MVNILLILFAFLFIPILGIPDKYDTYLYLIVIALLAFEWFRLWKTRKIFRDRVRYVRREIKMKLKSFFKEEEIVTLEEKENEVKEVVDEEIAVEEQDTQDISDDNTESDQENRKRSESLEYESTDHETEEDSSEKK